MSSMTDGTTNERNDLVALRGRLEATRGREYWRSLESLAETAEFKEFLHREFPQNASEWLDPVGRRSFLKLMSASLALAGVSACTRQPDEEIVPYVRQPEEEVPGKPLFFATAMPMNGAGVGLLVESHEGRPTKIEGNPDHPSSRGATDLFAQASVLGLYDPDRSRNITNLGDIRPFNAFVTALQDPLKAQEASQGAGIRILTETVASPTLGAQIREFLTRFPQAKWIQWEPAGRHNARAGSQLAFGEYVDVQYAIEKADVILSLDADFLCTGASGIRHSRAFASRRRLENDQAQLNRLYAVESDPTNTGSRADHRLPLKASEIEAFARVVAARIGVAGVGGATLPGTATRWVDPLVSDLQASKGRSLVIAGDGQPGVVHALAHAMNEVLGNVGTTVTYTQTAEVQPIDQRAALRTLVNDMNAGTVAMLIVMSANPVYSAPVDLKFADAMQKVALRVHLGLYEDETAALCHWQICEAHYLESWSDVRADDGTVTIIQPLIAPLYGGKSAHEVMAALSGSGERPGYDLVRAYWSGADGARGARRVIVSPPVTPAAAPAAAGAAAAPAAGARPATPTAASAAAPAGANATSQFDRDWRQWLHDGVVPNTAFTAKTVAIRANFAAQGAPRAAVPGLEAVFRPDPTIYDGRFANNAWLQELPKSLTKLTWDNAALISPGTADRHRLVSGDIVELKQGGRSLRIPVWLSPGQARDTVTLHLGYGRTRAGRTGNVTGFDVTPLRTFDASDILQGVELTKTGESYQLACTQDHWSLEGRNLVRVATKTQYEAEPKFAQKMEEGEGRPLSMYRQPYKYEGYAWGMTIDQNVCTGCNSCVVACVAENNVPVVGKAQVMNGREMHWLRVDRYYTGDIENPDTYHQPMPCQQCENASCEVVCPVAATTHSDEGLNDMVYNRCVGTRYCSNNCPYKVRRFNFLLYQDWDTQSLWPMRNPDVTVRSRGVMEKCTYCVQRISQARIAAKLDDRQIRDGEILTACQAACPTNAIVFGNINDPASQVSKQKSSPRNYTLLAELTNRPRTSYLALVRNPNTELEAPQAVATDGEAR
jgi:MoCo/4Fe-4S cofactor protein with predicted Tat translocation signal